MRMTDNNFGSNLRLALAIAATAGVMICLWLLLHSCTPQTLDDDRPTGTGIALRLGTVSMERGGKAPTRASSAITTMSGWEFATEDLLNVYVQATGSGTQASKGVYSRNSTGGWEPQTSAKTAYWQRSTGNTVSILWGPEADGKVYHLPDSYDALPDDGMKEKMWNGTNCYNFASLWRYCDPLRYQASGIPAQNALSAELSHSMAQLCVELTAGKGMTEKELKTATVSILGAYGCYTTDATRLQPVACKAEDATTTSSPTTKDITLLKNGSASLKHYALLLPGQVFLSSGRMIKISIGSGIYYYTPTADVTLTAGNCLNLKLQVDKTAVNAVNVSSTGWDSEVTTGGKPGTDTDVRVVPSTAGNLTLPADLSGTDNKLMITGEINGTDLETLKSNMDKFSELYINATLSGTTALPSYFAAAAGKRNLKVITLPKGMTSIGDHAFWGCTALTSISLPEGMTSIGSEAFSGCAAPSISLPEGLTKIEERTFIECYALTSISLPKGLTSIGVSAFESCKALTSISLPEGLTSIEEQTFRNCAALTSISLPEKVTSIKVAAFNNCAALTSISLPEKLTSIGGGAFHGCAALTSISLPEGVTSIEERAFYGCAALTSISLPKELTSIGHYAFQDCTALASISLPEGMKSIGGYAFENCTALTKVILLTGTTLPTCGIDTYFAFNMQSPSPVLFLPAISAEEFAAATDKYTKWGSPTPAWSAVHYAYSPGSGTTPDDYANPDNYLGHWP